MESRVAWQLQVSEVTGSNPIDILPNFSNFRQRQAQVDIFELKYLKNSTVWTKRNNQQKWLTFKAAIAYCLYHELQLMCLTPSYYLVLLKCLTLSPIKRGCRVLGFTAVPKFLNHLTLQMCYILLTIEHSQQFFISLPQCTVENGLYFDNYQALTARRQLRDNLIFLPIKVNLLL